MYGKPHPTIMQIRDGICGPLPQPHIVFPRPTSPEGKRLKASPKAFALNHQAYVSGEEEEGSHLGNSPSLIFGVGSLSLSEYHLTPSLSQSDSICPYH